MPCQKAQGKKPSKIGTIEGTRKALADNSKVFGTSLTNVIATLKGVSLMQTVMSKHNKSNSQTQGDPIYPCRESVGNSIVTIMKTQPLKLPKLRRQISLGKHGFGIAVLKAIAGEIQTEHVNRFQHWIRRQPPPQPKTLRLSSLDETFIPERNPTWTGERTDGEAASWEGSEGVPLSAGVLPRDD